jgi:alkylresorcinol/alkylpyrone synthase
MNLTALANENPRISLTQREVWESLAAAPAFHRLSDSSRELLRKVLCGNSGICQRQFASADLTLLSEGDAQDLNELFEREAPALAIVALNEALDRAGLKPSAIDALLVCTCTGYLCPGVSSHVAERVGLRRDAALADLVGLGCGAAIPMLRQAEGLLRLGAKHVACIAVEICSAAFFLEDDPGVLVSMCLFGDGASASIWSADAANSIGTVSGFRSLHIPEQREFLRFINSGGKLKNVLAACVPDAAADAVRSLYESAPVTPGVVLAHPGGKKVLNAIRSRLPNAPLIESARVLARHGNMSSPSIMFVLEEWLQKPHGDRAWLVTFGAGFTCHCCDFRAVKR